jgi:allantoinase
MSFCDLIIRSRRVLTPQGVRPAAILIKEGRIHAVLDHAPVAADCFVEDAGDLAIMPGLIDAHVHLNAPGRTEWEGFETATRAAAAGGITTLVDMPLNSTPVTTTVAAFEQKLAASTGKLGVDCGFYAGLIPENSHALAAVLETGVLGVKAFLVHSGIDDFPNATESDLRAAMPAIAKAGLPLLVHAELKHEETAAAKSKGGRSYAAYLASRPKSWEQEAIALMLRLCQEYSCRVHVVHLSSAAALPLLRAARAAGLPITVETCPHYLFFAAEEIAEGDTRFKCAPPIREKENREQLWQALREGAIDFVASDHSPCPPEMKLLRQGDFQRAWGGISSLQFMLSIMWTAAQARGFSLFELGEWLARRPAAFLGLQNRKGAIAPGYDADLVIWNPEAGCTVTPDKIYHRHKITPYEGRVLQGKVEKTFLRGVPVYGNGKFIDKPMGKAIRHDQALR